METFIEFFTFQYSNIKYVVFGSILLSISSAVVGCFTFVKKKSLVGDVISHAVLPGICIAFLTSGNKNPYFLIIGAFITGWLSILVMDAITRNTKVKEDAATGLSLSVFFGIGMLILTYIQQSGNASQSGLDTFLFGKAAALIGDDLIAFSIVAILVLVVIILFYKEFKIIAFDPEYAKVTGLPIRRLEFILTSITVLAVVTGIQAVGVVLMAAMLITPAAAARFWTHRFLQMIFLAALFAAISGVSGAYISYAVPSMPTGPWIVMIASLIAIFSFFFSPKRGILMKQFKRISIQNKLLEENLLKAFYKLTQSKNLQTINDEELQKADIFNETQLKKGFSKLKKDGYLIKNANNWVVSKEGLEKGKKLLRLHRLWELYLTKYLNIAPDHVHDDADTMEHILTPEIEAELEKLLDNPKYDPHQSIIPSL